MFAERIGLAWNPPTDDGGSKITNYVVEKREDNRKSWVHVSNDPKECAYVVTRLTENHEYEFRVMAQNKFGVGPPLVSEPEKARNLFSEFRSVCLVSCLQFHHQKTKNFSVTVTDCNLLTFIALFIIVYKTVMEH